MLDLRVVTRKSALSNIEKDIEYPKIGEMGSHWNKLFCIVPRSNS